MRKKRQLSPSIFVVMIDDESQNVLVLGEHLPEH